MSQTIWKWKKFRNAMSAPPKSHFLLNTKGYFCPTHTRTVENWVIFYLHSSQNDFFFLFGEIVRAYQFYCPFFYNFKTEFRVTAKSKPFFLAQFFATNSKILIVCSCFILHALWLDFFQKKVVSLKKDYDRKNKKSNIKNLKLSTKTLWAKCI